MSYEKPEWFDLKKYPHTTNAISEWLDVRQWVHNLSIRVDLHCLLTTHLRKHQRLNDGDRKLLEKCRSDGFIIYSEKDISHTNPKNIRPLRIEDIGTMYQSLPDKELKALDKYLSYEQDEIIKL